MFVAEMVELPASTAQPLVAIAFDKEHSRNGDRANESVRDLTSLPGQSRNRCVIGKRILRRHGRRGDGSG